ncbi:hypothetical protein WR25_22600 [Diploscapter pachys]|uniref:AMP-dependent synthetase/ligase domain-containing protein n=1 Tax=Diploscapter pachys TaxID=2018661 RepID=A0A2A2JP52_9BILA|nr:hypothetical protein WR25_22600 [Diploscapter pachys]
MTIFHSSYPSLPVPDQPYHKILISAIERQIHTPGANKIAFIHAEDSKNVITYEKLLNTSKAVGTYLHSIGFGKNIACAVVANVWQYPAFFLGVAMNGGAVSGASALFTDYELERQFKDSKCMVVLTSADQLAKVEKAAKGCTDIRAIIVIGGTENGSNTVSWDSVASTPIRTIPEPKIDIYNDLIILPYSSGTTGPPKGVMLSHFNLACMMELHAYTDIQKNAKVLDDNWDYEWEKILLFLPFYHAFGFGLLNFSLLRGSCGIIFKHFEPPLFLKNIQEHKIRMIALVPPILVFLAKHPVCDKFDLSSMEAIICGAAPAGREICYGMTECTMASHVPDFSLEQPFGCVGKLLPNLMMKIIDTDTGKELGVGERGEICVKGPTVMLGYFCRDEATKNTLRDGWLHTGDIGYADKDGNVFIVDRLKELIKVKGYQVPPAELEDLLLTHPGVLDAAVIGIPDRDVGEKVKAYIVKKDNALIEADVVKFVESKVSPYKRLTAGVEFIKEIPKSAAGKILRRFLRDQAAQATSKI